MNREDSYTNEILYSTNTHQIKLDFMCEVPAIQFRLCLQRQKWKKKEKKVDGKEI